MMRDEDVLRENSTELSRVWSDVRAAGVIARETVERIDDHEEIIRKLFDLWEVRQRRGFASRFGNVLQGQRVDVEELLEHESFLGFVCGFEVNPPNLISCSRFRSKPGELLGRQPLTVAAA